MTYDYDDCCDVCGSDQGCWCCEGCGAETITDCECCPRCGGSGYCHLLAALEWDYIGSDYGVCPRCGGCGQA